MFHDLGLMAAFSSVSDRFEVDGANAARGFLRQRNVALQDIENVWTAIALHTTPGIPKYMHPLVALVTAGVEMDVLGIQYDAFSDVERDSVTQAYPRAPDFKEAILQAFYDGTRHKADTTLGNVKADVLADKERGFQRHDFCDLIRSSAWAQ